MKKNNIVVFGVTCCLLAGCTQATAEGSEVTLTAAELNVTAPIDTTSLFSDRDLSGEYDEASAVNITLNGSAFTADGNGAEINGSTLTINDEGVYILSGTMTEGQIIVNAEDTDKVQIVLDNADITCASSAPIYVKQADKTFVTLAEDSENSLTATGEFIADGDTNVDGVIFSKDDITLNGSGSLTITSACGNGVVGKDELTIAGGSYTVNAADHGFQGKDSIAVSSGEFNITSGSDGFHSENNDDATLGFLYIANGAYNITASGDGISAGAALQIDNGTFSITTGGGSEVPSDEALSAKGVKAGGDLYIAAGTFNTDTSDDSFHTNGNLSILSGSYTVSSGDDGFHGDMAVVVEGGNIAINKCYEGIEGESIWIADGVIDITAEDDGLNAAENGEDTEDAFQMPVNADGTEMTPPDMPANADGTEMTPPDMPAADGTEMTRPNMPANADGTEMTPPDMSADTNGADTANQERRGGGMAMMYNENCQITISGGTINVYSQRNDGIDSNGDITISGGNIYVETAANSIESPLDAEGDVTITGGTIVAAGSSGMFTGFAEASTQGWAMISPTESGTGEIALSHNGEVILSFTPLNQYPTILISCPEMADGESFTLSMGEASTEFTITDGSYTEGTSGFGFGGGFGGGNRGFGGENGGGQREQRTPETQTAQ